MTELQHVTPTTSPNASSLDFSPLSHLISLFNYAFGITDLYLFQQKAKDYQLCYSTNSEEVSDLKKILLTIQNDGSETDHNHQIYQSINGDYQILFTKTDRHRQKEDNVNKSMEELISCYETCCETKLKLTEMQLKISQLEQLNSDQQNFVYIVSHDLNSPLRVISNFLGLISKNYNNLLDEKGLKYIRYSQEGATQLKKMLNGLLDYSRLTTIKATPEWVDLNQILSRVILENEREIEKNKIKINRHKGLPQFKCIPQHAYLLIKHTVENSIKHGSKDIGSEINISFQSSESFHQLTIEDNGSGIGPQLSKRAFDIFTRLDPQKSIGMGLALCKKICHLYGGDIALQSEKDKGCQGCHLLITLPVNLH